ncbi:MAG TPA: hypothetical protein VEB41_04825 [Burkholderiales bacterium]|nr:hypothetical protein [Burkholderiales bacterium]
MSEGGAAIASYAFRSGLRRGSQLTLYANCLVHRGPSGVETLPLYAMASIRISFERDPNRLAWGIVALLVSAVLYAISAPLAAVSDGAAADVAGAGSGVAVALHTLFRIVAAAAGALPILAIAGALGGAALIALGWIGRTVLGLTFPGGEREYGARGRDSALFDFAEAASQKLMQLKRP